MDITKLSLLLWNDEAEEYQPFVKADLRSGIRSIEIPEVNSSDRSLTVPEGNVIESIHFKDNTLEVRAGAYSSDEPKPELVKVPPAVALAEAIFVKEVEGKQRIFLKNSADNSGNIMLYECEDEQTAESHRCAIVDNLLRALERSC